MAETTEMIGFIGGGNMAFAIASGMVGAGDVDHKNIRVFDPDESRRKVFSELGVRVCDSNAELISESDTIFLCVKPQMLDAVANDLSNHIQPTRHRVVSILAGVPTTRIEALAPQGLPVIRVMPNTPMLVGQGMSAICPGANATDTDVAMIAKLLTSCSEVVTVDESMMDAVTAVSGSGPAYLFYLAESMQQGAESVGFDPQTAAKLVTQTLLGAATLLAQSDQTASELRNMVTSPGGTTQAAVQTLDDAAVRQAWEKAIVAARNRSIALGRGE